MNEPQCYSLRNVSRQREESLRHSARRQRPSSGRHSPRAAASRATRCERPMPARFASRDWAREQGMANPIRRESDLRERAAAASSSVHFLNVTMPANETYQPASIAASASCVRSSVAMQHSYHSRLPRLRDHRSRVVFRIPRVDDNRLSRLTRQCELLRECAPLLGARRVVVMIVEAAFAYRDRTRLDVIRGATRRRAARSNPLASCGCTPAVYQTNPDSRRRRRAMRERRRGHPRRRCLSRCRRSLRLRPRPPARLPRRGRCRTPRRRGARGCR